MCRCFILCFTPYITVVSVLHSTFQCLRTEVAELNQKTVKHKAKEKDLRDKLQKKEEELESVRLLLQHEQETGAAQQRMMQHYEVQQKVHKEERAEFLRTQRKLAEFKHVDTLVSGECGFCPAL